MCPCAFRRRQFRRLRPTAYRGAFILNRRIAVVTHSPSPYQVELFDAVAATSEIDLVVVYLYSADPSRSWSRSEPLHSHIVHTGNNSAEIRDLVLNAELLVVNYYRHRLAATLMRERFASGQPWAFWGERLGFHYPTLGKVERRFALRVLHRSNVPIWGVGEFALDGYRNEFSSDHAYINLPYFSDLERFRRASGHERRHTERIVLFSGSLIPRKGVDCLAQAFLRLALRFPKLRLRILGSGPLEHKLRKLLTPVEMQVDFLGFRDWAELPAFYASADVLCVPSRYDGWGLVVPEGLAAGLPVIATTRMGAGIDLVRDQESGWLVRPGDWKAILRVLREVGEIDDAALRYRSECARSAVAEHQLINGARRFLAACDDAIRNW